MRFLDGLRGLAAFYVMVSHVRWLLWEGYEQGYKLHPERYDWLDKLWVFGFGAFRYGHEAVLLFFVLSGFVIHLRYAQSLQERGRQATFDVGPYLRRRARRILPPLIFALVLTWVLDRLGNAAGYAIYRGATRSESINRIIGHDYSLRTLAGNLALVMGFYVPTYGSDSPLWSLAYEGWFYLLYPLCFWLSRRWVHLPTVCLAVGLCLGTAGLFPLLLLNKVLGTMLCWWVGAILADLYTGRCPLPFPYLTPLALLGVPLLLDWFRLPIPVNWLLWSLTFMGVFAGLFWLQTRGLKLRALEGCKWLGDMSYSLYVTHFPIMVLWSGWLMARNHGLLPQRFGHAWAAIAVTLVCGYLVSLVVEKPFLRKKMARG